MLVYFIDEFTGQQFFFFFWVIICSGIGNGKCQKTILQHMWAPNVEPALCMFLGGWNLTKVCHAYNCLILIMYLIFNVCVYILHYNNLLFTMVVVELCLIAINSHAPLVWWTKIYFSCFVSSPIFFFLIYRSCWNLYLQLVFSLFSFDLPYYN